jgi:enoyl reductase-like protein
MIDELSKGTLGSYVNKAATKIGDQGITAGLKIANDEKSEKNFKTMGKRQKGIATAVKKMTKEDVISRAVEKYSPSEEERTPLDEQLVARIEDMQESHIHLILNLFEQLDESNQRNLMDMIDQGRINEVLDFAISAVRGE